MILLYISGLKNSPIFNQQPILILCENKIPIFPIENKKKLVETCGITQHYIINILKFLAKWSCINEELCYTVGYVWPVIRLGGLCSNLLVKFSPPPTTLIIEKGAGTTHAELLSTNWLITQTFPLKSLNSKSHKTLAWFREAQIWEVTPQDQMPITYCMTQK